MQTPPPGYKHVFREFANDRDPTAPGNFARAKTRGALNVLREVDSAAFGGVANVERFEVTVYPLGPGTKKRVIDVITNGRDASGVPKRLELKAWETNATNWGEKERLEFVGDILYSEEPKVFEWVIKGTDLEKVKNNMLQTLGVLRRGGKTELHPMLEAAVGDETRLFNEDALEAVINKVNNLEILRKESY